MMTDEPASNIWDTARFLKLSADMEHDDPEQAPELRVYHSKGPPLADVMHEIVCENPRPHGRKRQFLGDHYCACCDGFRNGESKCIDCGAPWERAA